MTLLYLILFLVSLGIVRIAFGMIFQGKKFSDFITFNDCDCQKH